MRTQTEALVTVHAADAASRSALLKACRETLAVAEDASSSMSQLSQITRLEARLDVLRTEIVERAFRELTDGAREDVESSVTAARKSHTAVVANVKAAATTSLPAVQMPVATPRVTAHDESLAEAEKAAARAEVQAAGRAAKDKLRAGAAAAAATAAATQRVQRERAQSSVRAACAQLAAIIPALPGVSKTRIADDLHAIAAEANGDPATAAKRLLPLRDRITRLISSEGSSRQRFNELSSRCTSRLDEIQASSQEPAVSAKAWALRESLAAALSTSSPDEDALLQVSRELDALAGSCTEGIALAEQAAVTETLMAALQRSGYQVGRVTEGSSFVAGETGGLGIQFDVGGGHDPEVKAAIVRLTETPEADPATGCALIDDAFERLSRDGGMPFQLRELARHLPQPLAELPYVDAGSVNWRANELARGALGAPTVRHLDLDAEAK